MPHKLLQSLKAKVARVPALDPVRSVGVVTDFAGLVVESQGPPCSIGDLCEVELSNGSLLRTEVIGFRNNRVLSMPLEEVGGLQVGSTVRARRSASRGPAGFELLGRVLDGFGEPIDGLGPLGAASSCDLFAPAPGPLEREPIRERLETGVRVIDSLLPCGRGQRVGIFGGSGVGKSTLLAALARNSSADVNVIAMIGERNREVRGFLEETLGEEGRRKSVVICATSDKPAPLRVRATYLAAAIADWFRAQGRNVLLIMDSVTRFAMAQREIGLAAGEPPSQKGYTPSVFQQLPKIVERAGKFGQGSVTGFYTVLVEGDDMNEPIADAVRGLLDGHIVLSRELASSNHYPAIDPLESVSRLTKEIAKPEEREWAGKLRDALAAYRRAEDLINLGAYVAGSNPKLDKAIQARERVVSFLRQDLDRPQPAAETLRALSQMAQAL